MRDADRDPSRRELLRATARWISLGLLAGGGAVLLHRQGSGDPCTLQIPCTACDLQHECELAPSDRTETPEDESWQTPRSESPDASS